jgi:hypothetical protein
MNNKSTLKHQAGVPCTIIFTILSTKRTILSWPTTFLHNHHEMSEKALYSLLQKYWSHCRSRQILQAGLNALASRTSRRKTLGRRKKKLTFVHLRWPKLELRCQTYEESNKSYGTHHQNACRVEEEEEEAMSSSNTTKPFFFRPMDATNKSWESSLL